MGDETRAKRARREAPRRARGEAKALGMHGDRRVVGARTQRTRGWPRAARGATYPCAPRPRRSTPLRERVPRALPDEALLVPGVLDARRRRGGRERRVAVEHHRELLGG